MDGDGELLHQTVSDVEVGANDVADDATHGVHWGWKHLGDELPPGSSTEVAVRTKLKGFLRMRIVPLILNDLA